MDPQQTQNFGGLIAGMGAAVLLFGVLLTVFFVWLFWRIFTKAGLAGPLSLLVLVPGIGALIVICILAFSQWRVVPASSGYLAGPTNYPPGTYPPSGPPAL